MDKLKMESKDLVQANMEKLAELFPGVITESTDETGKLIKLNNYQYKHILL